MVLCLVGYISYTTQFSSELHTLLLHLDMHQGPRIINAFSTEIDKGVQFSMLRAQDLKLSASKKS